MSHVIGNKFNIILLCALFFGCSQNKNNVSWESGFFPTEMGQAKFILEFNDDYYRLSMGAENQDGERLISDGKILLSGEDCMLMDKSTGKIGVFRNEKGRAFLIDREDKSIRMWRK